MNIEERDQLWRRYKIAFRFAIVNPVLIFLTAILATAKIDIQVFYICAFIYVFTIGAAAGIYLFFWYCSKCNKPFTRTDALMQFEWHWPSKCFHCGLPVGATDFEEEWHKDLVPQKVKATKCFHSHLPEDNPTGICKGCGEEI